MPPSRSRLNVFSGSEWEDRVGYARAVRLGNTVHVSGTTAMDEGGNVVGLGDAAAQTRYILERIDRALRDCGASLSDVVRTRIYVTDIHDWEPV